MVNNRCKCKFVYIIFVCTLIKLCRIAPAFNAPLQSFLSQGVSFFAYFDSILPQLRTEDFFYHQNSKKCLYIDMVEKALKSPAYPLSCYPEGLMNLFAISSLKDHVAGALRLQLYPQVLRFGQLLQAL